MSAIVLGTTNPAKKQLVRAALAPLAVAEVAQTEEEAHGFLVVFAILPLDQAGDLLPHHPFAPGEVVEHALMFDGRVSGFRAESLLSMLGGEREQVFGGARR